MIEAFLLSAKKVLYNEFSIEKAPLPGPGSFCLASVQFFEKRWDELTVIGDDCVVRYRHDRRRVVCIYAHNALGVLHTGKILSGTGDADVYNELRLDGAAALTELAFVPHPAAVGKRP